MRRKSVLSDKSKVQQAVKHCSSVKKCLQYLGLRSAGGNYKQFYNWCNKHGIVPPKGDNIAALKNSIRNRQKSLTQILRRESDYSRSELKRRLIQEGLLKNECYECGCLPEWNGKPLSLQIDHINGVGNDNRLENLRILCPNCHTQTNTFAGRNLKQNKPNCFFCCNCSSLISKYSKKQLCRKCAAKIEGAKRRKERPPLDVLKAKVKNQGYCATGREYGVSDNAIRKWLKEAETLSSPSDVLQ